MIRQIWNHPKEGELQLKIYAHITHEEQVDQTLIQQINDLEEEEALWYLRKMKELLMHTRVLSTTKHLKTTKVQGHTFSSPRM